MKKSFIPALSLLLLTASCAIDEGKIGTEEEKATDIISAYMESPSGGNTKLCLDGTYLKWQDNDKISVVGTTSATFTLSSGTGYTSGTFTGKFSDAGTAPYFAVSPNDASASVASSKLSFTVPQVIDGSNSVKSFPMAGAVSGGAVQFNNLFGLLKMNIRSDSSVKIKKIALHDLGGNVLWGTCEVPIKQDGSLDYANIQMTAMPDTSSNTINLVYSSYIQFYDEAQSCYFPVPPGALDHGFSLVLYEYDNTQPGDIGKAYTFLQKVSSPVTAQRSVIININTVSLSEKSEPKDVKARGYYKSLFVDAGYGLSQYYTTSHLPWIPALSMSADYEYFDGRETDSVATTTKQREILITSDADANGVLLYPDNSPRFRMVYVNGGSSEEHGETLEIEGCERFHQFFHNGGSYVGTCAGSFMATTWYTTNSGGNTYSRYNNPALSNHNHTFGIWPGTIRHTRMPVSVNSKTGYRSIYTAMKAKCSFAGFSEGDTIELVRHHGGSFLNNHDKNKNIEGAEELFSYQYTEQVQSDASTTDGYSAEDHSYTEANLTLPLFNSSPSTTGEYCPKVNYTSIWAYKKPDGTTGRAVLCGSHPESEKSGKKLNLMKGMVSYALEGTGNPKVKQNIAIGDVVTMDASDTKIGDRQYHHFTFDVPSEGGVKVSLNGIGGTDANLYLALKRGDFAWMSDADYVLCTSGNHKTFKIKSIPEGKWYLSVYCASTVIAYDASEGSSIHYFEYFDPNSVLNGVPYTILIEPLGTSASQIDSFVGDNVGTVSLSMDD